MSVLGASAARQLGRRSALTIDATGGNAVKRNAHRFVIDASAARFAEALRQVLIDPEAELGGIRLGRVPGNSGRDFAVGERFQGCFSLASRFGGLGAGKWRVVKWIEERLLSDYAEITELALEPDAGGERRVCYRYLSGGPMAGQSEYIVRPLGDHRCELQQVFTYQETGLLGVLILHRFGHAAHDRVVLAQAEAAAQRCGGVVVSHTVRLKSLGTRR